MICISLSRTAPSFVSLIWPAPPQVALEHRLQAARGRDVHQEGLRLGHNLSIGVDQLGGGRHASSGPAEAPQSSREPARAAGATRRPRKWPRGLD